MCNLNEKCPLLILDVLIMLSTGTSAWAQGPTYDLLLKGGHVVDPANHVDAVADVAVSGGKVAAVERNISANEARKVVDVTDLYVTPGLVDIHVHVGNGGAPLDWFEPAGPAHVAPFGVPADLFLTWGVTTAVDAGSSGADTFLSLKESVMDHSRVRVLAFLNIVADGMNGGLEQDVDQMNAERCAATIQKYSPYIVGVKTAHYWTEKPWDEFHPPWAAVDRAGLEALVESGACDCFGEPRRTLLWELGLVPRPQSVPRTRGEAKQLALPLEPTAEVHPFPGAPARRHLRRGPRRRQLLVSQCRPGRRAGIPPGLHLDRCAPWKHHRARGDDGERDVEISRHGSAARGSHSALHGESRARD